MTDKRQLNDWRTKKNLDGFSFFYTYVRFWPPVYVLLRKLRVFFHSGRYYEFIAIKYLLQKKINPFLQFLTLALFALLLQSEEIKTARMFGDCNASYT